jgi:hypothetical protein
MDILWNTFGLTGLASCLAWAAAGLLLAAGILPRRRIRFWVGAAALGAIGVLLGIVTSESIRAIEVDRSAEVLAAEAEGAKAAQQKLRGRAADIRFAEDTAADQADIAGVTVAEEQGAYERAVETELAKIPAYRSRGRQQRKQAAKADATKAGKGTEENDDAKDDAGKKDGEKEDDERKDGAESSPDGGAETADDQPTVRALPEAQLVVADRYDRINRAAAWSVFALALGLVSLEYVRLFNSTFDAVWPLPLAGTVIDGLFAKSHVVDAATAGADEPGRLSRFLEQSVRKGESFVLFAADDPLPARDRLDRLSCGPLRWGIPKRTFASAAVRADRVLAETVFETAWFGRGAFVLTGEAGAADVIAGFVAALERRHACRAVAARTFNIVWALPDPPAASLRESLDHLSATMNLRVVLWR